MNTTSFIPRDAIAAVTHPDPYPWYREQALEAPLAFDAQLGLWVAASAEAVQAVLTHPAARVRPPAEPVPRALAGGAVGALFSRWARMNDGELHAALKPVLSDALAAVALPATLPQLAGSALQAAVRDRAALDAWLLAWPVQAMAQLLGLAPAEAVAQEVRSITGALAAQADDAARRQGEAAAQALVASWQQAGTTPLRVLLADTANAAGIEDDRLRANALGLLVQTQDATAGLVANTLRLLAHDAALAAALRSGEAPLAAVLDELLRFDAPVQNTRRWLAEDALLCGLDRAPQSLRSCPQGALSSLGRPGAGLSLRAGDAVLVLLAAANHDPRAHDSPERFDWRRPANHFTFGRGVHACPGSRLARELAATALQALLAAGLQPATLQGAGRWHALPNARIACFS